MKNTWKIYRKYDIIFRSSKDNGEEREMLLKSKLEIWDSTKNLINASFRALFANYQESMVKKLKGNEFIYDFLDRFYYGCHEITLADHTLNLQISCKTKKAAINHKSDNIEWLNTSAWYVTSTVYMLIWVVVILSYFASWKSNARWLIFQINCRVNLTIYIVTPAKKTKNWMFQLTGVYDGGTLVVNRIIETTFADEIMIFYSKYSCG